MARSRIEIVIDGIAVECDGDETILSVARRVGIEIPTLCFLEGVHQIESCGLCMVEAAGEKGWIPACASKVREGMRVRTETPELDRVRRTALELLFSDHLGDCLSPCERACPAHIDIPGFIREIKQGRLQNALVLIQKSIALVGVLGRVCPRFCERVCRRAEIDAPIPICALKRHPADHDLGLVDPLRLSPKPATGKEVAIVGGGIVGLTAAFYLSLDGHACTLYESRHRLGGALDDIIPEFRMPKDVLSFEIAQIVEMGVRVEYGMELGVNLHLQQLRESHDAVLLAIGAAKETLPEVEGAMFGLSGLRLLKAVADGKLGQVAGPALVVGSGPTALDVSRTLLRLGASPVTLAMTPSLESSLFFKTWIPDAVAEGVNILDRCEEIRLEQAGFTGHICRFSREGVETTLEADHLYLAGGVAPDLEFLQGLGLEISHQGVRVDRRSHATSLEGVFAAGSIAQAGRYAVQGSEAGHQAALSIDRFLNGLPKPSTHPVDVRLPHLSDLEKTILFAGASPTSKRETPVGAAPPALFDFAEIDPGFDLEGARREAELCLQCDCAAKKDCLLRIRGTEHRANPKAYSGERPLFEREESHPEIVYEPGKCIRCGRCVSIARDRGEPLGLTPIGRGFAVRVRVPFDRPLSEGLTHSARECAEKCPTGALSLRR